MDAERGDLEKHTQHMWPQQPVQRTPSSFRLKCLLVLSVLYKEEASRLFVVYRNRPFRSISIIVGLLVRAYRVDPLHGDRNLEAFKSLEG
jgi:hypothetical protein